jgi:hypothetical protein
LPLIDWIDNNDDVLSKKDKINANDWTNSSHTTCNEWTVCT